MDDCRCIPTFYTNKSYEKKTWSSVSNSTFSLNPLSPGVLDPGNVRSIEDDPNFKQVKSGQVKLEHFK